MTKGEKVFEVFNVLIMLFMIIICTYPFLYIAFASFSEPTKLMSFNGMLWKPLGFSLDAYKEVMKNKMVGITYLNTLLYVSTGTLLSVVLTSMGAFILSRDDFKIKKFINIVVVITMFFSGGLIPFYLTLKGLGFVNSRLIMILPTAIGTWNLMVMRTSFEGIPKSLEEAAYMDGASDLDIFIKVILPLSKSIIAVMVLFYGVGIWNSWFNASLFLKDRNLYPLQLYLREILIYSNTDSMMGGVETDRVAIGETIKYTTIMVTTLPILMIYPFLQKYFVKGVMVGAVKG